MRTYTTTDSSGNKVRVMADSQAAAAGWAEVERKLAAMRAIAYNLRVWF